MRESIKHIARFSMAAVAATIIGAIAFFPVVYAIQASPNFFEEVQPDGTKIRLRLRGDEHYHWMEDENGYTVVRSRRRGYMYGRQSGTGRVVATRLRVGRIDPKRAGLSRRIMPSPEVRAQMRLSGPQASDGTFSGPLLADPVVGTKKNLVVLVRFANHTTRPLPSRTDIDTLFNAVGGDPILAPTGSVRDFYTESSYGQLTLESTVLDWVTLPQTEAYYANGNSALTPPSRLWDALRFALDAADPTINFNDYDTNNDGMIDAIAFIHSGYGAEIGGTDAYGTPSGNRIWSHKWTIQPSVWTSAEGVTVGDYHISPGVWGTSGSAIGRIGVICHETGHFFGLPDLYDTDSGAGDGIGSWGLMANSWGFDGTQYYPPHPSSWSKIQMGWVTPTVLSAAGMYTLPQFETNAAVVRIDLNYPTDEYLLIENRQPVGFDADMPQGGLCIFHIDDQAGFNTQGYPGQAGWPGNGNHYRVSVLQADGNYNLEKGNNRGDAGDVYHAGGINLLSPTTTPNTDAYQSGVVLPTGITISSVSASGSNMTFNFTASTVNALADISLSDSSVSYAMAAGTTDNRSLGLSNTANSGGQALDYSIGVSVAGQVEDLVGTPLSASSGSPRYRGNIYQATSNTTLTGIDAFLNFTGTATLTFVVYEMPGLAASDLKTLIFSTTGTVASAGPGFYGSGPIDVPLQSGMYYGIATAWSTGAITYYWDQNLPLPTTSFGPKVGIFSYNTFPLPSVFTGSISTSTFNYYQRLSLGVSPWFSAMPTVGSVAPQGTTNITVTADATGFTAGTYEGTMTIVSNDSDEGIVNIPVGLLVGLQGDVQVQFDYVGVEFGTPLNPYNTLTEGLDATLSGPASQITIVGGGFSGEMPDINKEVSIVATGGEATIGVSSPVPVVNAVGAADVDSVVSSSKTGAIIRSSAESSLTIGGPVEKGSGATPAIVHATEESEPLRK